MIEKDLGDGWTLTGWSDWVTHEEPTPSLRCDSRDIDLAVDDDGDVMFSCNADGPGSVTRYIPLTAVNALLMAYGERNHRNAERAAKPAPGGKERG